MRYVIGIAIVCFIYTFVLFFAYFFLLLVNEIFVRTFDVDPLKWIKREILEPVGRGILELVHKHN